MAIKRRAAGEAACLLFVIYAQFSDLMGVFLPKGYYRYLFWLLVIGLMTVSVLENSRLRISRNLLVISVLVLGVVLFSNQALRSDNYFAVLRWVYCFLFMFFYSTSTRNFEKIVKQIAGIGCINVAATWFFWLFPSAYSPMYSLWGYWPSGTWAGTMGYKAALQNHYSRNGVVLAATVLALFALIAVTDDGKNKKQRRRYWILFFVSLFALLLTTKRAHVLFSITAMVVVLYFNNRQNGIMKMMKLLFGVALGLGLVYLASFYIPEINQFIQRFSSLDEDTTMQSRFVLWSLAFNMFLSSPLFGNGWFSFRYRYNSVLYANVVQEHIRSERYDLMDAHNVYLQLSAETGIIGLAFYLFIVGYLLRSAMHMLRYDRPILKKYGLEHIVLFSAVFQVFYLMYSFTGNCLYDITFAFYCISAAVCLGCRRLVMRETRRPENI